MQHNYHLIYKTTDILTGEYYIGQHRTNNLNDGYKGSGNWVKTKTNKNRVLHTEVIHMSTAETLCEDEKKFIGDLWKTDPYCMNECPGGGSGPHKEQTKIKIAKTRQLLGIKPTANFKNLIWIHKDKQQKRVHNKLVQHYINLGWNLGMAVQNLPNHTNKVWITKGNDQIRVENPTKYLEQGWTLGRVSTNYNSIVCPHCNKSGGINVMKRWHMDRCKYKK